MYFIDRKYENTESTHTYDDSQSSMLLIATATVQYLSNCTYQVETTGVGFARETRREGEAV